MELPDEAISYHYEGLLIPPHEDWTAAAELRSQHFLSSQRLKDINTLLMKAKSQVAAERDVTTSPGEGGPIESGFIDFPQGLLDGYRRKGAESHLGRIIQHAAQIAENADRIIVLGDPSALLPGKIFLNALKSSFHNELPAENRLGASRIYFEGDSADNDALQELLDLNQFLSVDPEHREERWAVVLISRSQIHVETAMALRALTRDATDYYGHRSEWRQKLFVPVLGPSNPMVSYFISQGYSEGEIVPLPENVGERFCALTAAGLLPAALLGLDVRAILQGAAAMTKRFLEEPFERNPVLQYAAVNFLVSRELRKPLRMLNIWSKKLEELGHWYTHLISGSLGKFNRGATPVSMVSTRDLMVRGQQNQEGPRDRMVTNLYVRAPHYVPIGIQMADNDADGLNQFARKGVPDVMNATWQGMNQVYWDVARPTSDLIVPTLTEHTLGQLLQMLMLATVVEARLMGINPYSRTGVQPYQDQTWDVLSRDEEPT